MRGSEGFADLREPPSKPRHRIRSRIRSPDAQPERACRERPMRHLLTLAAFSAWNRRATLAIAVVGITLSVTLLVGVERLRQDARETFSRSVSGTDLVIGPRTSPVH